MRSSIITPTRLLLLVLAFLLFSSFARLEIAISISAPPRDLIRMGLDPATYPLHALATSLRGDVAPTIATASPDELAEENRRLLQYARQLEDQLRIASDRIGELSQMRSSTALKLDNIRLVDAGVTRWQGGAMPTLSINRGSDDGIALGMIVASGANLIGRIASVSAGSAGVSLINAPGTLLDVRILPPTTGPAPHEVVVQCQPMQGSETFWAEAAQSDPIQAGDLAHLRLADNVLASQMRWRDEAAGMIVGQVMRVEDHPADPKLRTRVLIEPRRKLQNLTRVVVLVPR